MRIKTGILFLALTLLFQSSYSKEPESFITILFGIPSTALFYPDGLNTTLSGSYTRTFGKRLETGIGMDICIANSEPADQTFTYDHSLLNVYLREAYPLHLSKIIDIVPEMNAGYAFLQYRLNEFEVGDEFTSGVSLGGKLSMSIRLSENLSLIISGSRNMLFRKYRYDYDIIIPANYIPGNPNQFIHWSKIETGLSFSLP